MKKANLNIGLLCALLIPLCLAVSCAKKSTAAAAPAAKIVTGTCPTTLGTSTCNYIPQSAPFGSICIDSIVGGMSSGTVQTSCADTSGGAPAGAYTSNSTSCSSIAAGVPTALVFSCDFTAAGATEEYVIRFYAPYTTADEITICPSTVGVVCQ